MAGAAASGGWTPARSAAGNRNPWLVAIVISISSFMEVLDTSIANVALQHIGGGLSVSYDESTWVLTSYLVANAIVIPASGWLASTLGRKRYYMISVAGFTVASFLCGIAHSLSFLILARVLQGAAGGGLQPTTQSMLIDSFPPAKRGGALALFGFTVILAPALGPTIGGWITETYSWNWIFLINVPVGLLSLVLVQLSVSEPATLKKEATAKRRGGLTFDKTGFALIAVGLGTLEIFADRGQRDDWFASPIITTCGALAIAGLGGFVMYELLLKKKHNLLDLRLFKNRNYVVCNVIIAATGVIFYGTTQFIPQFMQQVLGYTATNAGLAMTLGGLSTVIAMPIVGVLINKVQPRWLLGGALLVEAGALLITTGLSAQVGFMNIAFARFFQAAALPFLFLPVTNAAYVGLPPDKTDEASAMLNVFRNLGGTIGISSAQTLLEQRAQFHQSRLVEGLTPLNPAYVDGLARGSRALSGLGGPAADQAALGQLYGTVLREAQVLSYVDVFWAVAIFVGSTAPLVLLLKPSAPGQGSGAG